MSFIHYLNVRSALIVKVSVASADEMQLKENGKTVFNLTTVSVKPQMMKVHLKF